MASSCLPIAPPRRPGLQSRSSSHATPGHAVIAATIASAHRAPRHADHQRPNLRRHLQRRRRRHRKCRATTNLLRCCHHTPHMRQPPRLPRQSRLGLPLRTLRQKPAHTRQPTSRIVAVQTPQPMPSAALTAEPAKIRRLPAGFATLPQLPSAGAPVRAGRYASPAVHRHTRLPATISAASRCSQHLGITTRRSCPRNAADRATTHSRRINTHPPPLTSDVRTFLTGIKN